MLSVIISMALTADPGLETYLSEYFTTYRGTNGLIQDRSSRADIFSIAATGFGMDVWAIQSIKGEMPQEQALLWAHQAIDFMQNKNPRKNRGWLYHFVDSEGLPAINSEVSTIDTAIFFWGARRAALRLGDKQLEDKVNSILAKIDVGWVISNSPSGKLVCHGLRWKEDTPVFLPYEWSKNSEGILIYRLFGIPHEPIYDDFSLPLFVYYFPMCFLPHSEFQPYLKQAVGYQLTRYECVGMTATDTQNGYQFQPIGYISPLCLYAIHKLDTRAKKELVRHKLSPKIHSWHLLSKWESKDRIGIDEGVAVLLHNP